MDRSSRTSLVPRSAAPVNSSFVTKIAIKPKLIQWAIERSRRDLVEFENQFPRLEQWSRGDDSPTLKQLEKLAAATHTPIGYFFLETPPDETLPVPDFRTLGSAEVGRPSPDLLDTIHLCQQRQDWYRQNSLLQGEPPLPFIGSATTGSDVVSTAARIREAVGFDMSARAEANTFEDALRMMTATTDGAGVLVMVSGIVGQNTHRILDLGEFRGFALSDKLAPLVFINGTDTKSGQMFTLAHELAHLWLGQSAVTDATAAGGTRRTIASGGAAVETWCNGVAAEMLVPMESFEGVYRPGAALQAEKVRLSKLYKVSTLVVLRRMFDAGGLTREVFNEVYTAEVKRLMAVMVEKKAKAGSGGDPYATGRVRLSPRFGRAVLAATWEGRSTFTEAFRLLGFKSGAKLEKFGDSLGMTAYLRGGAV